MDHDPTYQEDSTHDLSVDDEEWAEEYSETPDDPIARRLTTVALLLLVAVLTVGAGLVWYLRGFGVPRTAAERDIAAYTVAVSENPEVLENHLLLAYAYAEADRLPEAAEAIARARSLSTAAVVELAEGDVYRVSDEPELALESYDRAIVESEREYLAALEEMRTRNIAAPIDRSTQTRAYYGRALTLWSLGKRDDAVVAVGEAIDIAPDDASLLTLYGDYLHLTGRDTEAVEAYTEALRFVPQYPEAVEGLRRVREASDGR